MYRAAEPLIEIPVSFSPKQVYRLQEHGNDGPQEDFKGLLPHFCPCKSRAVLFLPFWTHVRLTKSEFCTLDFCQSQAETTHQFRVTTQDQYYMGQV